MANNPDIDIAAIERHYAHAVKKHPHFCDLLTDDTRLECAKARLRFERAKLSFERDNGCEAATDILDCEITEIVDAYARHDYAAAVEECHDAIAVLLRMARMIEDEAKKDGEVAK